MGGTKNVSHGQAWKNKIIFIKPVYTTPLYTPVGIQGLIKVTRLTLGSKIFCEFQ